MQTRSLCWGQFGNGEQTQDERVEVTVELAYEGDTFCSDTAKRRNSLLLRNFRCADKQLSWFDS